MKRDNETRQRERSAEATRGAARRLKAREMNQRVSAAEAGFIYLDVMFAIVIMMVGVVALAGALTVAIVCASGSQQQLLAKQYAAATMEVIFSARDIDKLGWDAIGNVGSNPDKNGVPQGIFLVGDQPIRTQAGANGIYGNSNDSVAPVAGVNGVVGTADDTGTIVPGFTRRIDIVDVCDPQRPSANCNPAGTYPVMFRQITVTVKYTNRGITQQEQMSTIMTNY